MSGKYQIKINSGLLVERSSSVPKKYEKKETDPLASLSPEERDRLQASNPNSWMYQKPDKSPTEFDLPKPSGSDSPTGQVVGSPSAHISAWPGWFGQALPAPRDSRSA